MTRQAVLPVILCGGAGTRLWPYSRKDRPKPFLPLLDGETPFALCLDRVTDRQLFATPLIMTAADTAALVFDTMNQRGMAGRVVLEPCLRDTCMAIAVATEVALADDPDALLLVLAADHCVRDKAGFAETIRAGLAAAEQGHLVTFGITPDQPHTGYGYIMPGPLIAGSCFTVERFVEKPDHDLARALIGQGGLWNSGNFLFRADAVVEQLKLHAPAVHAAARRATHAAQWDKRGNIAVLRPEATAYVEAPGLSFDHAVMEHTRRAATTRARHDWTDIGSFQSLWEVSTKDADGNASIGPVMLSGVTGAMVCSEGLHTVVVGVADVAVVATPDAVLVAPRHIAGELKAIVAGLASARDDNTRRSRTAMPWGWQETLLQNEMVTVRRVGMRPGAQCALAHSGTAHCVVVKGSAVLRTGGTTHSLAETEAMTLPAAAVFELDNATPVEVELLVTLLT